MRIGLLGGTFNPIHQGHLQIACAVWKKLKLDTVFFIPTGKPPHKKESDLAPRADRFHRVCLALENHPHFKPCDIEITRKGISYTIDTIRILKRIHPDDVFFFILGTDALFQLPQWKLPEQLLCMCHFVIVPRAGYPYALLPRWRGYDRINRTALKQLDEKKRDQYIFSTSCGTRLYFTRIAVAPISASAIRTGDVVNLLT